MNHLLRLSRPIKNFKRCLSTEPESPKTVSTFPLTLAITVNSLVISVGMYCIVDELKQHNTKLKEHNKVMFVMFDELACIRERIDNFVETGDKFVESLITKLDLDIKN
jgi:hypothetical protein